MPGHRDGDVDSRPCRFRFQESARLRLHRVGTVAIMTGMAVVVAAAVGVSVGGSGKLVYFLALLALALLVTGWNGRSAARRGLDGALDIVAGKDGLEVPEHRILLPWADIESVRVRSYLVPWIPGKSVTVAFTRLRPIIGVRARTSCVVHTRHYAQGDDLADVIQQRLPDEV